MDLMDTTEDVLRELVQECFKVSGEQEVDNLMMRIKGEVAHHPGNDARFCASTVRPDITSPLWGRCMLFLGSSVTVGACSLFESFVDFLWRRDGVIVINESVSGTTLANEAHDGSSYVERLRTLDTDLEPDVFVCQLSTNDATKGAKLGRLQDQGPYDTSTTAGAMQDVVTYVRDTWGCAIAFYTNTYFENARYAEMVRMVHDLSDIMDVSVIDLYNDPEMRSVTEDDRRLYMFDDIHPTRAGYKLWWLPVFERELGEILK